MKVNLDTLGIEDFIRSAEDVLFHRAFPNVCDNMKDVQRRALLAAYREGLHHKAKHLKMSTVVGLTLRYHPHGDSGVKTTLDTLGRDFKRNYPLVDIRGNVGDRSGSVAASARYLEMRLSQYGDLNFFTDLHHSVVPFVPNFDNTTDEPEIYPAVLPDFLINGNQGIGVGFANNSLSHNLHEVVELLIYYVKHRNCSIEDLIKRLPGPDFPNGGTIVGQEGIERAYRTGVGDCIQRGEWKKTTDHKHTYIEITNLPFDTTTERFRQDISKLAEDADKGKLVLHIINLEDHSNMDGIRICLKLDDEKNYDSMVSLLLSKTCLQVKHQMIHNVIHEGKFCKHITLLEIVKAFVEFRSHCLYRKFKYELSIVNDRLHIIEGVLQVMNTKVSNLNKLVETIRKSKNKEEATKFVERTFHLTRKQAEYIVNMRLYRISSLEIQDYLNEQKKLLADQDRLTKWTISSQNKYLDEYMIKQWKEFETIFYKPRKTKIISKDTLAKVSTVIPCKVWYDQGKLIVGKKYKGQFECDTFTTGYVYLGTKFGYLYQIKVAKIMRNPNIEVSNLIHLRDGDEVLYMTAPLQLGQEMNLVMYGGKRLRRVLVPDHTIGTHGKRIFTGETVLGMIQKYNYIYLQNGVQKIKLNMDDLKLEEYYSIQKLTKSKGMFTIN